MPAKAVAKTSTKKAKTPKAVAHKADGFSTLRKSITPGTVAIVLAGRFRGKRAIVLKQLPKNGPLVISGPFKLNGVPLRRIDSRYIIATSTKIDIAGVDTSKITVETFKRAAAEKRVKGEGEFMGDKAKKAAEQTAKKTSGATKKSVGANGGKVSDERRTLQKTIDAALVAALKKDTLGKQKAGYLKSVFTVKPGDAPHRLKW
eukprot:GILJ01007889.1.p1 GENE.GILJ01007889.1~~GILJ01007889.1.p1  ORF type:complete len:203 (+),score=62.10 GILJ01007889.1:35-643(+)